MNYDDHVAELVDRYHANETDYRHSALMATLGCRTWSLIEADEPEQPPISNEATVLKTLLHFLRIHIYSYGPDSQGESILNGLLRNDRWKTCLQKNDSAYDFALLVTRFYTNLHAARDQKSPLQLKTAGPLHLAVSEWLKFDTSKENDMTGPQFLRLTFGDAWYDLTFSPDSDYFDAAIIATRPPFMPGLLPTHLETAPQTLPSLGAS